MIQLMNNLLRFNSFVKKIKISNAAILLSKWKSMGVLNHILGEKATQYLPLLNKHFPRHMHSLNQLLNSIVIL